MERECSAYSTYSKICKVLSFYIASICIIRFSILGYNTYSSMCTKVRKFKTAFRPVFHILHNHDRSRIVSFLKIMRYLYIKNEIALNLCIKILSIAKLIVTRHILLYHPDKLRFA